MPEHDGPGLLILGLPSKRGESLIVRPGNNADIEATKREARSLVSGLVPTCSQVWIVRTVWEATPEYTEGKD